MCERIVTEVDASRALRSVDHEPSSWRWVCPPDERAPDGSFATRGAAEAVREPVRQTPSPTWAGRSLPAIDSRPAPQGQSAQTTQPDPVDAILRAVAAWGLPTTLTLPDEPLDGTAFAAVLAGAEQHRILGFLGDAVRDGAFPVTEEQWTQVEERWSSWLAHALRVERLLLRAADALDAAGIDFRVLKGVALAHLRYDDPALRVFGDVDLLVRSADFTRAANVLITALKGQRALPELRPGFDERFGKEILVRVGAFEVDVHRTLVDGAYGLRVDLPDLFTDPQPFTVGERTLLGVGPEAAFLHACFAAALGDWPPRLVPQRDIAQIALGRLDVDAALAMATRWRASAVVGSAVTAAWDGLGLDATHRLAAWARSSEPSRRDGLLLRSYRGSGRGYSRTLASLAVLRGVGPRAAYAIGVGSPSKEYLAARGLRRSDLARRLGRSVRNLKSGPDRAER